MTELHQTPLHALHVALGARMVPFAGFDMPVQYTSILEEHAAVRNAAGLFDVSHMGQIHLCGPDAQSAAERLVTCRVDTLRTGRVRYGLLCNDRGGVVDDVTVYRVADDEILICVNASNIAKDRDWIVAHASGDVRVDDRSDATGLLALQGPASAEVLSAVTDVPLADLGRFTFAPGRIGDAEGLVSRTGYTGSDGFELYVPAGTATALFRALLAAGEPLGLQPAGLGARDTLRLEAALPLYGHELTDDTSPLEAGLGRFVKRKRGGFIGAEALEARAKADSGRALVGFVVESRRVARAGQAIRSGGTDVGIVTSGAPSPTLGKPIGLGYVPRALATPGTRLEVDLRGREVDIQVVETPFLTKSS